LLARVHALLRREHHFLHTQVSNPDPEGDLFQDQLSIIWERTKDITFSRIQDLFEVLQTLEKGDLSQTLCERSQRTAHKLAGSLGTFGFTEGSKIAQTLEKTFAQANNVKACLDVARPLILELHQVVIATDAQLHDVQHQQKEPSSSRSSKRQTVPILLPISPDFPRLPTEDQSSAPQLGDLSFDDEPLNFSTIGWADAPENADRSLDYILLVDSDLEFAQTLAHDSGSWKLDFKAVQSIQEAFEVLRDSFPKVLLFNVDLIVDPLDWQTLKDLCQKFPLDLAIVILSEFEGLESRFKALELQADIFLQKPVTSSQLFASVSRSMNFHSHQRVKVMVLDDDEQVTTLLRTFLHDTYFQGSLGYNMLLYL
ncbi:MAG: Hpt domain-containing protein, partial [Prochlorotrichaceae cyanobacterium]